MTSAFAAAALAAVLPPPHRPPPAVPAWTASQQPVWDAGFLFPTNVPSSLRNRTLRQVARLAIGGGSVRIVLANTYGREALAVAGAHVALSAGGSRILPVTDRVVTFGGGRTVTVAAGASVVSDPIRLSVQAGRDLAVSLRFDRDQHIGSFHWDGRRTGYVIVGNALDDAAPAIEAETTARLLLAGVLVDNHRARGTVVVMGDSITDGAGATLDAETRWPDYLARRAAPAGIAVVNAGISGARLLADGMGRSALARMDGDVLSRPGARTLILLLGTNDVAWPGTPFDPDAPLPRFEALAGGYRAVADRAHAHGLRVLVGTLPPFAGALPGTQLALTYHSPAKDALRHRINEWIRTSGVFDGVLDFDRLLRDPKAPDRLADAFDSGDHLHPGDAGNEAMAQAVDLATLTGD